MRWTAGLGVALAAALLALGGADRAARAGAEAPAACRTIEMFSRPGCPHCTRAREFLTELSREIPGLEVRVIDVERDPAQRARLRELAQRHGARVTGVPSFLVCGVFLVGFDSAQASGPGIRAALGQEQPPAPRPHVRIPGIGVIDAERVGLPLFTVALGLLDGFNPCAMWVLLILLSVLVGVRDRRKLLAVAGTFVAVSGLAYFAFMAAWLNAFLLVGYSRALQVALALVALGVGAANLRSLLGSHGSHAGFSFSIPDAAKPWLYHRIGHVARAQSLAAAVSGALALALLANAVELLCTAALPALYTQILALQRVSTGQYYAYLALYNLAYVLDDSLLVGLAVVTLRRFKLQERGGRWLKGLSGGLMLALGLVLLLRPGWVSR